MLIALVLMLVFWRATTGLVRLVFEVLELAVMVVVTGLTWAYRLAVLVLRGRLPLRR